MPGRQHAVEHLVRWISTLATAHAKTAAPEHDTADIYQTSTISALLDGVYESEVTIADILAHGDFGLGTFNRLDGEMVILDGICHHLRSDGTVAPALPTDRTPFAAVTRFQPHLTLPIAEPTAREELLRTIDAHLESTNLMHAVRVEGRFSTVHTRTVAAQHLPYPSLTEATQGQSENVFEHVTGTLVGFRTPDFEQGIAVAGYHMHFLDTARHRGGHALDFTLDSGQLAISTASELHLSLPSTGAFLNATLSGTDMSAQIRQAEGGG